MKKIFLSPELNDNSNVNVEELSCHLPTLQRFSSQQLQFPKRNRYRQKNVGFESLFKKSLDQRGNKNIQMSQQMSPKYSPKIQWEASSKNVIQERSLSRAWNKNKSKNNFKLSKRKNLKELKDVVTNQKINGLTQIFIDKIKRNNLFSSPVHHQLETDRQLNFLDRKGLELKESVQKIINIICILNIVSAIFIYTLCLVFQQINNSQFTQLLQIFGAVLFSVELVINLITVRFSQCHKIQTLRQIFKDYIEHRFYIDIFNLIAILININTQSAIVNCLNLVLILKLSDCMQKLEKLQVHIIQNYYNEQYWSLVKVFMFNFGFAHFLAIIMISMSDIDSDDNWMVAKRIDGSPWFQKYTWAYYWATTMMLTIGFGDIVPSTYKEALCMIFLQTISCIVLAYNINCVGGLVANIRSQDIEKSKNLKIFKKLADKNKISQSLTWKVNNYIEENANIRKLFNIEQEAQFVQKLPATFRVDYLKQANKIIFQKLFFFSYMMQRTLFALAEFIEVRITHPEQMLLNSQTYLDLLILKKGQIGYISCLGGRNYSKFVFDRVVVNHDDQSYLLHANFITKKRAKYGIKSIVYSVIYELAFQSFIDILKEHKLDYELYCHMKDKHSYKLDEFQVFACEYCNKKHTKFSCPKLHYIPLHQHVIQRQITKEQTDKNARLPFFQRRFIDNESSLTNYLFNKQIYKQKKQQEQYALIRSKKMKNKKFLIENFKRVENQVQEFGKQKTVNFEHQTEDMAKVQKQFLESTSQLLKMCIWNSFGNKAGEDEIWLVDLDRMKNYKDYFSADNPCNLEKKLNLEQRLLVRENKQRDKFFTTAFFDLQQQIQDQLGHITKDNIKS